MDEAPVTHRVIFSGNVQGVGFRWSTKRIAGNYPVTGFVYNLPDGQVELVAQGPAQTVSDFLESVEAHFHNNIRSSEQTDVADSRTYDSFVIRE